MEKRGLGKGLAALISDTMAEEGGQAQVRELPIAQVSANPYQPRTLFDPIKQEELVASIKAHGVLQPILVRRVGHERFQIVAGERRFRAAQAAGSTTIPALVKECTDREQLEMAIVENVQREDIGPIEAARAYQRMSEEFGMTQDMIAQRVGKSRTAITNTIGLLDLPETILDSLERGEITEGHARALKAIRDPHRLLQAFQTVVRKQLSVRETEKLAREMRPDASGGSPSLDLYSSSTSGAAPSDLLPGARSATASDPNETSLLNELQELLKTKVSLRRTSHGGGRIEIEFYSPEELIRIVETSRSPYSVH